MKSLIVFPLAVLLAARCCSGEPELVGASICGDAGTFAVSDGAVTRWLSLGQEFAGVRLVRYDRKREALVVESDGAERILPWRTGRVAPGEPVAAFLTEVARQETIRRDGWTGPVRLTPRPFGDGWRVLATLEATGEARIIFVGNDGLVRDYWRA